MPIGNAFSFLKKLVNDTPERAAERLHRQLVPQVNRLEDALRSLSDDDLRAKTDEFVLRLDEGATLDDLLPEAFAVVREAARRILGQRHYDVHLIGGAALHQGKIAEIKNGEDKNLVATLPAYLNALTGYGVHIVTADDYMARRDLVWMGPIYHLLGLTAGCLQSDSAYFYDPNMRDLGRGGFTYLTPVHRDLAYRTSVLYGAGNEFGFDYLRDNMAIDVNQQVQTRVSSLPTGTVRPPTHHFAIVDEVDDILIDGARIPLVISDSVLQEDGTQAQGKSATFATITVQNYFRMYHKLAGMTSTAVTEADEFYGIYGLQVVDVPTNMPGARKDASDLIFPTAEGKWQAVIEDIIQRSDSGQPVLVGTTSIETSEALSDRLWRHGVQHRVLNSSNYEQHSSIIAHAGRPGAVTLSPVMFCRGANITLGGAYTDGHSWQDEHNRVVSLGGLHVIGTEHHEVRRFDNQLRECAGHQGDPGSSQFFVSMEDELIQSCGDDSIKNLVKKTGFNDNPSTNNLITGYISSAQAEAARHHFQTRQHMLNFDDVLNQQRSVIYEQRSRILAGEGLREHVLAMLSAEFDRLVFDHLQARHADDWNANGFVAALRQICPPPTEIDTAEKVLALRRDRIEEILDTYPEIAYKAKERVLGLDMEAMVRLVLLRSIDTHWVNHQTYMENLRTEVGLQSVGQRDPLTVYRSEGQHAFDWLTRQIQHDFTHTLFHVTLAPEAPARE